MAQKTDENKLINRYLFGELSDKELAQIEERYFADEAFFGEILEAENSLIDSYARGYFSASERGKFEKQFLITPQRHQKVKFAQSLNKAIGEAEPNAVTGVIAREERRVTDNRTSWWQSLAGIFNVQSPALALGMAGLLLMIIGVGLVAVLQRGNNSPEIVKQEPPANNRILLQNNQQSDVNAGSINSNQSTAPNFSSEKPINGKPENNSIQQKQRNEEQAGNTKSNLGNSEKSTPPQQQTVIASFLLSPTLLRGEGERTQITVPAKANRIRLQMNIEANEYFRYRATIQNPDGEEIWSVRVPKGKKRDKTVTLLVPVKSLSKGDYRLILRGETAEREIETISEYPFSVLQK